MLASYTFPLRPYPLTMRSPLLKRLLDVAGAGVGLVLTAPLMGAAALAVWVTMGPPVLFQQRRPGQHEQPFTLYKLRTMREAVDADGRPLPDADRLTRLGRFLRRASLDELPELFNVLRGEMSLVGPRPLLMDYLGRYTPQQARRHTVKPGLTGLVQVSGRNALSWEEKFALDLRYVDEQSLWLDLRILACTPAAVLRRKGAQQPGRATTDRFAEPS